MCVWTFALAIVLLPLIKPDAILSNPVQQQLVERPLSHDVRCVIRVNAASWKQSGHALVYIRLENLTDRDLDLRTVPSLYLANAENTYWSPVDILQNKPLDVRKEPIGNGELVSIEPVPLNVHLGKHSSSEFQIDAAETKWDREISSVWPSFSLRSVRLGSYSLRLELSDTVGSMVRSNEVRVSLEKADSDGK